MSYDIKQVILYRKDLNMRKGKIASQVAHASMKVLLDRSHISENENGHFVMYTFLHDEHVKEWLVSKFAKIVLEVMTENDLILAYEEAIKRGLPASLITDAGLTEFHGVPTKTCVAIGPAKSEEIDKITGKHGIILTKLA